MANTSSGIKELLLAAVAVIGIVIITAIGPLTSYINSYFTESVTQNVANDLRRRM